MVQADDRNAQASAPDVDDAADRMQEDLEKLDRQIETASSKAQVTAELSGQRSSAGHEPAEAEMGVPAAEDRDDGDAEPGAPLEDVVGESDVAPGDDAGSGHA